MVEITKPSEIEESLYKYHSTLISHILVRFKDKFPKQIVELGSGPGTFTIPLIDHLNNKFVKLYCVDSYTGPYVNDKIKLKLQLAEIKQRNNIEIMEKDARNIDKLLSNIDLVIGHEVLSDLNAKQVTEVLSSCYKILKYGSFFIHSELSPVTSNRAEELVQLANEFSQPISDTTWFSPTADQLTNFADRVGFSDCTVEYKKIPLRFRGTAAIELLKRWKIRSEFFEKYRNEIMNIGIEFPNEQIFICRRL